MGLLGLACLMNRSLGRQKTLQPTVKPFFYLFPFGVLARKGWVVERLETLLKIPARRASSRVRGDGVLQGFVGLAVYSRAEHLGFRARFGGEPTSQQRHKFL